MTYFLIATPEAPTPVEAWLESEGWVFCHDHGTAPDALAKSRPDAWLIVVPEGMDDSYKSDDDDEYGEPTGLLIGHEIGQCPRCYDGWVDGLRQSCEDDAVARWER